MSILKKSTSLSEVFVQLLPYIYKIRVRLALAFLLVVLSVGCSCSIPYIFKMVIDNVAIETRGSWRLVALLLFSYGGCWLLNQCMERLRSLAMYTMLEQSKRSLSVSIVDKLLSLAARYHIERQTAELTNSIDKAMQGLENIFWGMLLFFLPAILELMLVFYMISSSFGIVHGLLLCGGVLGYAYVSYKSLNGANALQKEHHEASAQVTARLVDVLLNIETVKYFTCEHYEYKEMELLFQKQEECAIKRWTEDAWREMKQMLILGIGILGITVYAVHAVYVDTLSLGTFILINVYLLKCMMPFSNVGHVIHQIRRGLKDMSVILHLLQHKSEIEKPAEISTVVMAKPKLTFKDVSFGYTPERLILKNISFSVEPGQRVAIVGPSGSGKSTIASLIFRMYDVTSGAILLNDIDIRAIAEQSVRAVIGIVPQEITLFNHTLYYNIAYGDLQAEEHEVYEAAHRTQLDKLISLLPEGYETLIGKGGLKLSGGEKQRIAIARTLLKKPLFYIFDEATSSLDNHTEREIQKSLKEISVGITTIIIAHRLSTIIDVDQIIVLDQGSIVGQGTHKELLHHNSLYAHLWHKQHHEPREEIVRAALANHSASEGILKL